jgi:hypothetical protein
MCDGNQENDRSLSVVEEHLIQTTNRIMAVNSVRALANQDENQEIVTPSSVSLPYRTTKSCVF